MAVTGAAGCISNSADETRIVGVGLSEASFDVIPVAPFPSACCPPRRS